MRFSDYIKSGPLHEALYRKRTIMPKPAKHTFLKGQVLDKLIAAMEKKLMLYTKKDFKFSNDGAEQQAKMVSDIMDSVKETLEKYGSLPEIDSNRFAHGGDIMRDIFPTYDLSYKTMSQLESAAYHLAVKMNIIPDPENPSDVKAVQKLTDPVIEKYSLKFDDYDRSYDDSYFPEYLAKAFCTLPFQMYVLNDDEIFIEWLWRNGVSVSGLKPSEVYKDFLAVAKKVYKF